MYRNLWLAGFFSVLIWSAVAPKDYLTWFLEVAPALLALAVLALTRQRFPLTPVLYLLILVHAWILMVGGHYTYAEVPAGRWVSDLFGWPRNNYDKLGHFAQGFVPALAAREVFIRLHVIEQPLWRAPIIVGFCLGISAFYEFIEWWAALISATAAESFLGTQGYVWDTQSDMFLAMIGAIVALASLRGVHNRQLRAMGVTLDRA